MVACRLPGVIDVGQVAAGRLAEALNRFTIKKLERVLHAG